MSDRDRQPRNRRAASCSDPECVYATRESLRDAWRRRGLPGLLLRRLDLRTSDLNPNYGSLRMLLTSLAFVAVAVGVGRLGLPGPGSYDTGRGVVIGIYASLAWLLGAGVATVVLVVRSFRK